MTDAPKGLLSSIAEAFTRPISYWILFQNVIPVVGVLMFGWKAFLLLLFYWLENVIIGVFTLLKIAVSGFTKDRKVFIVTLFLVPFFCIHYGIFCFGHGMFLLGIMTIAGAVHGDGPITEGSFDLLATVRNTLATDSDFFWSAVSLVGMQLFSFAVFWLLTGTWRTSNPAKVLFEPYGRIVVMHLTIMIAAIPAILLGQAQFAILVLALLKCGLELGLPQMQFGMDRALADMPDDLSDDLSNKRK